MTSLLASRMPCEAACKSAWHYQFALARDVGSEIIDLLADAESGGCWRGKLDATRRILKASG